jgi:hypothetical protein
MLRNVLVGFEPLGSEGDYSISAGYNDTILQWHGVFPGVPDGWTAWWVGPGHQRDEFKKKPWNEQEIELASHNRQRALKWIAENPAKVPLLMFFKVRSLWRINDAFTRIYYPRDTMLLFFSALGGLIFLLARPREALALLALLAACSMGVAVTWDMGTGRFLVPVLPILAMLSALGLWAVITATEGVIERIKLNK